MEIDPNTGVLSGAAYSSVGGWINFAPTGEGVSINSDGEFDGFAFVSGVYGGWMKFDCATAATCIKTDWRPIPARGAGGGSSGGGGGGGNSTRTDRDEIIVETAATTTSVIVPVATTPSVTTPSVVMPAYVFTKFLSIGAKGAEVSAATQRVLTDLGHYTYGEVTGYFGPVTKQAVIAFQRAESIPPFPGHVGPGTRAALNRYSMPVVSTTLPTPVPTPVATSTPVAAEPPIRDIVGTLNNLIKSLGQLLNR